MPLVFLHIEETLQNVQREKAFKREVIINVRVSLISKLLLSHYKLYKNITLLLYILLIK